MQQRIVCAAMRQESDKSRVILSVRHWDKTTHWLQDELGCKGLSGEWEQGFMDNKYNFLTRQEDWKVAMEAGQIIRRCGGDESKGGTLYSENLY